MYGFLGAQVNLARVFACACSGFSVFVICSCEQMQEDFSGSKEQWVKERQEYPFRI